MGYFTELNKVHHPLISIKLFNANLDVIVNASIIIIKAVPFEETSQTFELYSMHSATSSYIYNQFKKIKDGLGDDYLESYENKFLLENTAHDLVEKICECYTYGYQPKCKIGLYDAISPFLSEQFELLKNAKHSKPSAPLSYGYN